MRKDSCIFRNFELSEKKYEMRPKPFLELYQDKNNKSIFFTYSYWETENDLENYRNWNF
jgi:hypothetical protein